MKPWHFWLLIASFIVIVLLISNSKNNYGFPTTPDNPGFHSEGE